VTGELFKTLGDFEGWVRVTAFSPNGSYFAAVDSSNHLRLWETENWELAYDIPLDGFDSINALDFSPNGLMVALAGKNGRVVLWNLANNTLHDPETPYRHPVLDIAFHPRDRKLISIYSDGLLRLWSYQP
jgi:WD40 repeat protein